VNTHVLQDDITFVGPIRVWGIECSGTSIYLREIRKYLSQESGIMLDFNACIDWVAFFIGEASSCLLSRGRFPFRLRVSTEDFVVQLPYICQNKGSLYSLLHTFQSKLSFSALLWWRKMVFSS
jgi:hypothetical protein